jgi:hypothetical protein
MIQGYGPLVVDGLDFPDNVHLHPGGDGHGRFFGLGQDVLIDLLDHFVLKDFADLKFPAEKPIGTPGTRNRQTENHGRTHEASYPSSGLEHDLSSFGKRNKPQGIGDGIVY